jgi:UDP-3-O-[3-hydroxymyristoyl] glucosamine N-acyltransferase
LYFWSMEFTAGQINDLLQGVLEGDPDARVHKVSKIEEGAPGSITFLANPKYEPFIYTTDASVAIVNKSFKPQKKISATLIKVDDAYQAFIKLLDIYQQIVSDKKGIEQPSFTDENLFIGENVYIGAFSYIGKNVSIGNNSKVYPHVFIGDNVSIGANTTIYPGVYIYHDCKIGSHCTFHSGAVIGADGFGFAPQKENDYKKVAQIGNVVIEDNVEVGANSSIDRATMGSTVLKKGVKLDNLIQIAHNVEIGENTVIAAQTGIAGSTKIGRDCMIGGQVGIVGHITIADKVKIAAQSGVGTSITQEGEIVQGSPAFHIGDYKRTYVVFKKLPELEKKLKELEQTIRELKQTIP